MNSLSFALANVRYRALGSSLTVLLLAISTAIIFMVLTISRQLEQTFSNSVGEVDMVVGAKGSPLQLILSAVFHLDAPTGNVPLKEVDALRNNPQIKKLIPLSYGDNYEGFRIVGSEKSLLAFYEASFAIGEAWTEPMQVVAGAKVAKELNLKLGQTFTSTHGLDAENEHTHEEDIFTVVGILEPTGRPIDLLLVTDLQSIWLVHDTHHEEHAEDSEEEEHAHTEHEHGPDCNHDHDHEHEMEEENREVTAALVEFKSSLGNVTIPRMVNEQTSMQAALPAIEINRLFSLLGLGERLLTALAWVLLLVSGLSLFISLFNSLKERKFELAMMRSFGASARSVGTLLLMEAWLLATIGVLAGIILSRVGIALLGTYSPPNSILTLTADWPRSIEWLQLVWIYLIASLAAALPVLKVYRMDVSRTLTEA
jgi:putative ABC transport system permease protein